MFEHLEASVSTAIKWALGGTISPRQFTLLAGELHVACEGHFNASSCPVTEATWRVWVADPGHVLGQLLTSYAASAAPPRGSSSPSVNRDSVLLRTAGLMPSRAL